MRNLNNISVLDLLPPNIRNDSNVQAAAKALDVEFRAVTAAISDCYFYSQIDSLPETVIDMLAVQFHADFYAPNLPIEIKRDLVKNAGSHHRTNGTPAAVEALVTSVFDEGIVEEWWEYGGDPFHFKVITFNSSVANEQADEFTRAVNTVKNVRSVLDGVEITTSEDCSLVIACVGHQGDYIEGRQVV